MILIPPFFRSGESFATCIHPCRSAVLQILAPIKMHFKASFEETLESTS